MENNYLEQNTMNEENEKIRTLKSENERLKRELHEVLLHPEREIGRIVLNKEFYIAREVPSFTFGIDLPGQLPFDPPMELYSITFNRALLVGGRKGLTERLANGKASLSIVLTDTE